MKRLLAYTALAALSTLPFANVSAATDAHILATKPPTQSVTIKLASTVVPQPVAQAVQTAPTPTKPAFDPNNQATWPSCNSNQVVWASDGACHDKPVVTPVAAAPTVVGGIVPDHQALMAAAGIPSSQWWAVEWTVNTESSWNSRAIEPTSGACGLAQELPCGKSGCTFGDALCELTWMNNYVVGRYGSWAAEVAFHQANGYY